MYVPGCGLCAYDIKDASASGVENVDVATVPVIRAIDGTVTLSVEAQNVAVYNVTGAKVAQAENASVVAVPFTAGVYVVVATVDGVTYNQKVVIK